jgi:plasmid segregation protein ParM
MIVGVDIGYGYTKAMGEGKQVVFPSVVGKSERIRYEDDIRRAYGTEDTPAMAFITEEGDRFVGELALLQSRVQWTLLDRSRVEDPSARLLLLAALSELVGKGLATREFRVVTGLPVNWYVDRDKIAAQWTGRHVLRRVNGDQTVHRLSIADVLVLPQPFGSLFDLLLSDEGQIADEDLARGRLGVIDIGTFTTDYVLVDALRYIEKGSGTIASAMSQACALVGRSLLDTYHLELRMHDVDRAIRRGHVTIYGEERDIEWLVSPVLDAISAEILAQAATLWGDGRDLDAILVTGGGALVLGERIQHRYRHARTLPDPALANVRGFLKYGCRKWRPTTQPGGQDGA